MDSKEKIRNELKSIEIRLDALARQKEADQLRQITDRLQTTAAQMEHDQRAKAYLAWAESKAYIDELKEQVQTQGVTATNPVTGVSCKLLLAPGGTTARTFGNLKAGSIVEISGTSHLVEKFDHSPAGSTATILPFTAKFQKSNEPSTPYSQRPCRFDHATKTLTVAPQDRLSPSQQVTIYGTKYSLIAQIGVDEGKIRYELKEVAA